MRGGVRLLETMRAGASGIALWPLHRARLAASAAALGVPLDLDDVELVLAQKLDVWDARVRLTVGARGDVTVEVGSLAAAPAKAWLDPAPFGQAGTRYCIYKTTRRAHYDARYGRARAHGADEALLVAPDGRVAEGTRTNVWIGRGGRLLTPSLSAGGLPGVMRAHLLATRDDTAEANLTPSDLFEADAVWLSNAVIGLVRVTVLPPR